MSEVRFAIVVDGEVAGTFSLDSTSTDLTTTGLVAALRSDPKIIEDETNSVKRGWTHNGASFVELDN
jgi:hypothetical protein